MEIEHVSSKASGNIKTLFKGKRKWYMLAGVGVIILLLLFSGKKGPTSTRTTMDGYPDLNAGIGGSGGGSSSKEDMQKLTDQFTKQLLDTNTNFSDLLNKQGQGFKNQLDQQGSAYKDQITQNNKNFTDLFGKQKDAYDSQLGLVTGDFEKQLLKMKGENASLFDSLNQQLLASQKALADQRNAYQSPIYYGGGNNDTYVDNGYGGKKLSDDSLQRNKDQVINNGGYSDNVNKYIGGLVGADSGQAIRDAANTGRQNEQTLRDTQNQIKENMKSVNFFDGQKWVYRP